MSKQTKVCHENSRYIYVSKQTKYLEYVIRLGVGPEGKDGREAVEERQGGEGDRQAPVSSLSRHTCKST